MSVSADVDKDLELRAKYMVQAKIAECGSPEHKMLMAQKIEKEARQFIKTNK